MATDFKSLAGWSLTGWDLNSSGNFRIELHYLALLPALPRRYSRCDVTFREPTFVDIDLLEGMGGGSLMVDAVSETIGHKGGKYRLDFGAMGKMEIEATDYVLAQY